MDSVGRASPSLTFVGRGSSGSGADSGSGDGTTTGVEAFFLEGWGCGVASEALLFAAGSRRSRAGSLRFSAMAALEDGGSQKGLEGN